MGPLDEYTQEELELIALECGDELRGVWNRWETAAERGAPEAQGWEDIMVSMMDNAALSLGIKGD